VDAMDMAVDLLVVDPNGTFFTGFPSRSLV